jgi:predicted MFS family arabinose efflux permease
VVTALTVGLRQVVGLYMPLVTGSLGTGVRPFATAMAVANLLWGISSILAGAISDKFGAGRVTASGVLLMMLGYYAMYAASTASQLMWSGVCIGIGVGFSGLSVMVGVIGRAASPDERTAAIATLGMANGIGNFILFPYTHVLIETLGWRNSILAVMATLAAVAPLTWFLSGKPRSSVTESRVQSIEDALREAFRLPSYWLLICGFFVCGFQIAFYSVHLPAYVASLGLPGWVAVTALTAVGVANIAGTYLAGQSSRYMEKRRALSLIYVCRCLVFLGLLYLPVNAISLTALSTVLGLFWLATIPLTSGLVSTFFGTSWLSMLFGIVILSHQLGAFAGIWIGGVLFDLTGSYELMWWVLIALGLITAVVHWPIREEGVARLSAEAV